MGAPTHSIGAPTHGMGTPTHGMDAPTHGMDAPTHSMVAPTHGMGAITHCTYWVVMCRHIASPGNTDDIKMCRKFSKKTKVFTFYSNLIAFDDATENFREPEMFS